MKDSTFSDLNLSDTQKLLTYTPPEPCSTAFNGNWVKPKLVFDSKIASSGTYAPSVFSNVSYPFSD